MLSTAFKSGGNYNYLLEWLCTGCVLIGVLLVDLTRSGAGSGRWLQGATLLLALGVAVLPLRQMPDLMAKEGPAQAALVERIAAAQKPVASENMVLLMRAGKPVIFEPAIVSRTGLRGTMGRGAAGRDDPGARLRLHDHYTKAQHPPYSGDGGRDNGSLSAD